MIIPFELRNIYSLHSSAIAWFLVNVKHKRQINVIARQFLSKNEEKEYIMLNEKFHYNTYLKKFISLICSLGVLASNSADRYLGDLAFSAQCMINAQVL